MPDYIKDAQDIVRYVASLKSAGAATLLTASAEPPADAGIFVDALSEWTPGETYNRNQPFRWEGKVGYAKADGTLAQAHQPPFSVGMESVYGVHPAPDREGVYPYTYNMAVKTGMLVREDNTVYECYNGPIDNMLWPPSQLAAHFRVYTPESA